MFFQQFKLMLFCVILLSTHTVVPVYQTVSHQAVQPVLLSLAWSPDGKKIAGAGTEGSLRIWDTAGRTLIKFAGITGTVWSVTWSPDSSKIATGGDDRIVRVWNAVNGLLLATFEGHQDDIHSVAWSPDGTKIASVSFDETYSLRLWDTANYQPLAATAGGDLYGVAWSPDSKKLAAGSSIGVLVFDNLKLADLGRRQIGIRYAMAGIAWSPDGNRVAAGDMDGLVYILDPITGQQILSFSDQIKTGISSVSWCPDGSRLMTVSYDSQATVKIWNAETGIYLATSPQTLLGTTAVWSPDGSKIAYGRDSATISLITAPTITQLTPQPMTPAAPMIIDLRRVPASVRDG